MSPMATFEEARERDAADPATARRAEFHFPRTRAGEEVVYLCGNSLGAVPRHVPDRLADVVRREWGGELVRAWNSADWTHLAARCGARIAPLIGAAPEDVTVGDSTSVTLFKAMVAAARMRPDRRVIVVEPTTFPTDGYVAQGVARTLGMEVRWCGPRPKPDAACPYEPDLVKLAEWADVLAIAARGDRTTEKIVNAEVINALGAEGIIVNISRGSVIDEDAMIAALKSGALGGAGLDVFVTEPTPASDTRSHSSAPGFAIVATRFNLCTPINNRASASGERSLRLS